MNSALDRPKTWNQTNFGRLTSVSVVRLIESFRNLYSKSALAVAGDKYFLISTRIVESIFTCTIRVSMRNGFSDDSWIAESIGKQTNRYPRRFLSQLELLPRLRNEANINVAFHFEMSEINVQMMMTLKSSKLWIAGETHHKLFLHFSNTYLIWLLLPCFIGLRSLMMNFQMAFNFIIKNGFWFKSSSSVLKGRKKYEND